MMTGRNVSPRGGFGAVSVMLWKRSVLGRLIFVNTLMVTGDTRLSAIPANSVRLSDQPVLTWPIGLLQDRGGNPVPCSIVRDIVDFMLRFEGTIRSARGGGAYIPIPPEAVAVLGGGCATPSTRAVTRSVGGGFEM